jgi:hypothetical protein
MIKDFIDNFKVAHAVVKQLRNEEWDFEWNSIAGCYCTAKRNGKELWVSNIIILGWFADSHPETNLFGYFWRHYVAIFGIIPAKARANKKRKSLLIGDKVKERREWIR